MKISIIIPAYNEEKTIKEIIDKIIQLNFGNNIEKEIIIINDYSKDDTLKVLQTLLNEKYPIKVLNNESNLGKSKTVVKGVLLSTGDYVVIQDADLEYDPKDLIIELNTIILKNLDFIYGNRFNRKNKILYRSFYIGNRILSFVSNIFTYPRLKKSIPDMEVCYKMVKGEILRSIIKNMTAKTNFGFEPELTAKLARYMIKGKHLNFDIIPISYFPRTIEEGKKIRWLDGVIAVIEIIKYNIF
jgi:glycosyltransferase involved in cell wall biosynthesis